MKKRIFIVFLILFFGAVFFLFCLESLSRKCPNLVRKELPDCGYLIEKYVLKEGGYHHWSFMLPPEPNQYDLDEVVRKRVLEVEEKDISGYNGIACGSYGFVSSRLPHFAEKYVKVHEALHLIGYDNEMLVNYKAGLKHPIGLIQTVFYTFFSNFKDHKINEYPCVMGNLWKSFKVYFLKG